MRMLDTLDSFLTQPAMTLSEHPVGSASSPQSSPDPPVHQLDCLHPRPDHPHLYPGRLDGSLSPSVHASRGPVSVLHTAARRGIFKKCKLDEEHILRLPRGFLLRINPKPLIEATQPPGCALPWCFPLLIAVQPHGSFHPWSTPNSFQPQDLCLR